MKSILVFLFAASMLLGLAACAVPASGPETTAAPAVTAEPTPEQAEYRTEAPFVPRFERILDGERNAPADVYCHTTEDGSFLLNVSYTDGTPYEYVGIVYDPQMFSAGVYARYISGGDAAGAGSADRDCLLTPLCAGETEVLLLSRYLTDDTVEGRAFHISIDEALCCALDWYEDGVVGVHYRLLNA